MTILKQTMSEMDLHEVIRVNLRTWSYPNVSQSVSSMKSNNRRFTMRRTKNNEVKIIRIL